MPLSILAVARRVIYAAGHAYAIAALFEQVTHTELCYAIFLID